MGVGFAYKMQRSAQLVAMAIVRAIARHPS